MNLPGTLALVLALGGPPRVEDPSPEQPFDVIVVVASGLRRDALAPSAGEPVMPALAALAARSLVFDGARAPSPAGVGSLASLWTSTSPCRHGVTAAADARVRPTVVEGPDAAAGAAQSGHALPVELATLPERFERAGYLTVAWCDGGEVTRERGFDRGCASFESTFRRADDPFENALDFVATRPAERRYLLVVQTHAARMPYRPPPELVARFADPDYQGPLRRAWQQTLTIEPHENIKNPMGAFQQVYRKVFGERALDPSDRAFVGALYAAGARSVDDALGRLLGLLERRGERERTVVVVLSDYGTALWEHGVFGQSDLHEPCLAVPLVVHVPGLAPERRGELVELVDVLPTLGALCGLERRPEDEGHDLFDAARAPREAAFAVQGERVAVRFGAHKALLGAPPAEGAAGTATDDELYDLARDPAEAHDLAREPESTALLARARELVRGWRAACGD